VIAKVTIRPWRGVVLGSGKRAGGYELHIEGVGVTQVDRLLNAEHVVMRYVETLTGVRPEGVEFREEVA
jgi:hypothetical protein